MDKLTDDDTAAVVAAAARIRAGMAEALAGYKDMLAAHGVLIEGHPGAVRSAHQISVAIAKMRAQIATHDAGMAALGIAAPTKEAP